MGDDLQCERSYPYAAGWKVGLIGIGMSVILTAGGMAIVSAVRGLGIDPLLRLGLTLVFVLMTLGFMLITLVVAVAMIQNLVAPPRLRVTLTGLMLPDSLRPPGTGSEEAGKEKGPSSIPFADIRWVRREGVASAPSLDKLHIVHALSPTTLVIEKSMMWEADFDELETVLRAAVPSAFGPAPLQPDDPDR
jgi:hypothetical protein